jgi:hypothetical protein
MGLHGIQNVKGTAVPSTTSTTRTIRTTRTTRTTQKNYNTRSWPSRSKYVVKSFQKWKSKNILKFRNGDS